MENEEKTIEQVEETTFGAKEYLDNLNALKNNMVSKDEYNKLVDDNKKLVNALTNGINYEQDSTRKEPVDIDKLRESLFSPDSQHKSNLQYFTEVLALRDAIIESEGKDIFLPFNKDYIPTEQDMNDSERIANNLRECIEYADGDASVFNVELQRRCGGKK